MIDGVALRAECRGGQVGGGGLRRGRSDGGGFCGLTILRFQPECGEDDADQGENRQEDQSQSHPGTAVFFRRLFMPYDGHIADLDMISIVQDSQAPNRASINRDRGV